MINNMNLRRYHSSIFTRLLAGCLLVCAFAAQAAISAHAYTPQETPATDTVEDEFTADLTPEQLERYQLAMKVIRLIEGEGIADADPEALRKATILKLKTVYEKNSVFAAHESAYPGIIDYVLNSIYPEMEKTTGIKNDVYYRKSARLLSEKLSHPDLLEYLAFLRSDAAVKLRKAAYNTDEVLDEYVGLMKKNATEAVTTSDLSRQNNKMAIRGISALSPEEIREMMKFNLSPLGQKITKLKPTLNQYQQEWIESLGEPDPILVQAVFAAMNEYIAKSEQKTEQGNHE